MCVKIAFFAICRYSGQSGLTSDIQRSEPAEKVAMRLAGAGAAKISLAKKQTRVTHSQALSHADVARPIDQWDPATIVERQVSQRFCAEKYSEADLNMLRTAIRGSKMLRAARK